MAAAYSTVASTIQTVEGWTSGSVSQRNNNPGNLKYVGQAGAIGADANGFAIFPSLSAGQTALQNQIALDASRGLTIGQFAAKYAPAQDGNDPASYAQTIASATGLSVSDPLALAADSATGGGQAQYTAVSVFGNPTDAGMANGYSFDLSSIGFGEVTISPTMAFGIGASILGLLWLMNRNR